jgi:hypothetical protein
VEVRHVTGLYSKRSMVMLRERLGRATDSTGFVNSYCPNDTCVLVHGCRFQCCSVVVSVAHEIVHNDTDSVGDYAR